MQTTVYTSHAAKKYNNRHSEYSSATVVWTTKERTVPCVLVSYVIATAGMILKNKPVCINALHEAGLSDTDLLTMCVAGRLMDDILADSRYYNTY